MADKHPTARRWLSFSNSDQAILREESRGILWNALVVPGTLATYYKQGVGGYVLASRRPYVIDPRTPLLQPTSPRADPRASHKTLAHIHDDEVGDIWETGEEVQLETWSPDKWRSTVSSVLAFQTSFQTEAAEKISKYEEMLAGSGMSLDVPVHGPERLIPPYWAVHGSHDPWWQLSLDAIEQGLDEHGPGNLMPVICLRADAEVRTFVDLIQALPPGIDRVFCWRGSWDEAHATDEDVQGWTDTIDTALMAGIEVTNMYGGALSILLTGCGLAGVNHGVGYSESRNEERLGSTGAPPMRYYVPRLRQFLTVPQAQLALDHLRDVETDWDCTCAVCRDRSTILDLSIDELKLHFLLCRRQEFEAAAGDLTEAVSDLRVDAADLLERFDEGRDSTERQLFVRGEALMVWAKALEPFCGSSIPGPHTNE